MKMSVHDGPSLMDDDAVPDSIEDHDRFGKETGYGKEEVENKGRDGAGR